MEVERFDTDVQVPSGDTSTNGLDADIFFFDDALELDNIDTMTDSNQVEDAADLSELVELEVGSSIGDCLQILEVGGDTVMTVEAIGSGDLSLGYDAVVLKGSVVGLGDIQFMLDSQFIQISEL